MKHHALATEPMAIWQRDFSEAIVEIAISPNGQGWTAAIADGTIVWQGKTQELHPLATAGAGTVATLAISADSCWLAAGDTAGRATIWDCRADVPVVAQQLEIGRWIEHLAWHPIDPLLAIGHGADLELWQPLDNQRQGYYPGTSAIFDLAWHPAGRELAIAGKNGVRAYSRTGDDFWLVRDATASLTASWSPDGRYLATANFDRSITIVDRQQPEDAWQLQGCPGKIRQLAWLAGCPSPCLAAASGPNIALWQYLPNQSVWSGSILEGHQSRILTLAKHPYLPILASGGADGYACLWSAAGEIELILGNGTSETIALAWHPDGRHLAIGDRAGRLEIYSLPA